MEINIGKKQETEGNAIIDLSRLVDTRLLVQANSGGGKSWAIRRLLEQSHGKIQHIVLDMEGEFNTLREKYDYILVGVEGDIPINLKIANLLPKKLLELGTSAIIDLYELKQHERIIFVKRFLDAMVNAPKKLWHPVLVIIDEAHVFCPEKGKAESMSSVIDICTRGRKRGYSAVLATQRLSKLHKDAAAECNNKLIGRTGLDVDMKRAGDELGFTSKVEMLKLRNLEPGQFYSFGPAISISVEKIKVGDVLTSHPSSGGRIITTTTPTPSKIKAVLSKLSDLTIEADKEIIDLDNAKKEIADLRRKLTISEKPLEDKLQRVKEESFKSGLKEGLNRAKIVPKTDPRFEKAVSQIMIICHKLQQKADYLGIPREHTSKHKSGTPLSTKVSSEDVRLNQIKSDVVPNFPTESSAQNGRLRAGAMRMLKATASFHPKLISKNQIATVAGMSVKSGTFGTYLGELKRADWIYQEHGLYGVTEEGMKEAGDVPSIPTDHESLLAMWRSKFRAGASRMLIVIADNYPKEISRYDLGELSGVSPSSGTFGTYLGELRRNGLIEVRGHMVIATKDLFPE